MSLTVKHLNADASFLLTFEPVPHFPPSPGFSSNPFTIVLDPWLAGASKIWHPKFSLSTHRQPSCFSSLADILEPDLVIISQNKTDHCHEATLKQLPACGTKTVILAEAAAAKTIRGWKHFDPSRVVTLPNWEDPRKVTKDTIHRITLPPLTPTGVPGEVTVAYIPQKYDLTGLHSAIGITYRPPTSSSFLHNELTPPASPKSFQSTFSSPSDRALSVIYSPHGCNYASLYPYTTSHLVSEAALPLTALLHCFDKVQNPWWLGGNICAGFPTGKDIAMKLCAKAWISAHDEDKNTTGWASKRIETTRFGRDAVEEVVSPRSEKFPERRTGTEAVILDIGGEMRLGSGMDLIRC
jgi:hypothetical protein